MIFHALMAGCNLFASPPQKALGTTASGTMMVFGVIVLACDMSEEWITHHKPNPSQSILMGELRYIVLG